MEPAPPPPSTATWAGVTATLHFGTPEGLSDVVVEDSQPAEAQISATPAIPSRRNFGARIDVLLDIAGGSTGVADVQPLGALAREGAGQDVLSVRILTIAVPRDLRSLVSD